MDIITHCYKEIRAAKMIGEIKHKPALDQIKPLGEAGGVCLMRMALPGGQFTIRQLTILRQLTIYSALCVLISLFINVLAGSKAIAASLPEPSYRNLPEENQNYVPGELIKRVSNPASLKLKSHVAMVYDERDDTILYERDAGRKVPIASLTKLMSAMVVIDANLNMDELITIQKSDRDTIRYSRTRLPVGTTLSRRDLLIMALVASENRAAFALARSYPGGSEPFVQAMNEKARFLGLTNTVFADAAGLHNDNVSTAEELVKLVRTAGGYSLIREYTTIVKDVVIDEYTGKAIRFSNTNQLVKKDSWEISLSKTGFTSDAGNCLVMKLNLGSRPLVVVLLNSWGKLSKYGDTNRIKRWIQEAEAKARRLKLI